MKLWKVILVAMLAVMMICSVAMAEKKPVADDVELVCAHEHLKIEKTGNPKVHVEFCKDCEAYKAEVEHTFKAGACTECGEACPHKYENGVCGICGAESPVEEAPKCEHEHMGVKKGDSATHVEFCKDCEAYEVKVDHTFKAGACTVCGEPCTHKYENGVCGICGVEDEHKCTEKAYLPGDNEVHIVICPECKENKAKEAHTFVNNVCVCGLINPETPVEDVEHKCTKKAYLPGDNEVHIVICPECKENKAKEAHTFVNNVCVCGLINPETPVEDAITCENGHVGAKVWEWTGLGYHNVICSACNETVEKGLACEYEDSKCIYCGDHIHTAKTYEWTGLGYHNVICPDCGYTVKGIECEYAEGKCIYCGAAHKHTAKVYEWTGHGYHNVICPDCGEIFKGIECEYVVVYNTEEATCDTDGKNWKYRECIYCGDQKDYAEEILPATGHEWVNNKCTVCGKKLTKIYYNNTMSSFGPTTKELVGGNDWYRVTPVDLSVDGVYTYDLIASNRYVVGKVTITVAEGALTVNYKVAASHVEVKDEALLIYASKADLAEGNAVTANVGAAINVAETFGEDTKVIVSLVLVGNYDALGNNVTTMVADSAAIAGMIANID